MRKVGMSIAYRFSIFALLVALVLSVPLNAHDGHQKNMSDEEMVMMEAELATSEDRQDSSRADQPAEYANGERAIAIALPEQMMQQKIEDNRLTSASDLISRLHPAVVHFPIALLLLAAVAEMAMKWSPSVGLDTIVRLLVSFGAMSAVIAALFGWFAGGWRIFDQSELLFVHRWNGTAIAVLSIGAWTLAVHEQPRRLLRFLLALIATCILVQGYYGGEMARGPNHLGLM